MVMVNNELDLRLLCRAARDATRLPNGRPSCISATAAVIDVLEKRGLNLRPVVVDVLIFNPVFNDPVSGGRRGRSIGSIAGAVVAPWSDPTDWPHHLVAVFDDFDDYHSMVLDPTLDQVNDARVGIELRPLAIRVEKDRLQSGRFGFEVNGSNVLYSVVPEDRSFERFSIWSSRGARTVTRDRIRGELGL